MHFINMLGYTVWVRDEAGSTHKITYDRDNAPKSTVPLTHPRNPNVNVVIPTPFQYYVKADPLAGGEGVAFQRECLDVSHAARIADYLHGMPGDTLVLVHAEVLDVIPVEHPVLERVVAPGACSFTSKGRIGTIHSLLRR